MIGYVSIDQEENCFQCFSKSEGVGNSASVFFGALVIFASIVI